MVAYQKKNRSVLNQTMASKSTVDTNNTIKEDDARLPGSYALKKWFITKEDEERHLAQLRMSEKMVNGVYVEDPDLSLSCESDDEEICD